MCMSITLLKLLSHLSGTNDLSVKACISAPLNPCPHTPIHMSLGASGHVPAQCARPSAGEEGPICAPDILHMMLMAHDMWHMMRYTDMQGHWECIKSQYKKQISIESTLHYVSLVEWHICSILNVRWFENVKLTCESLIFFNTWGHEYAFKWCENQCLLFCDNSNYVVEMGLSPLMNRQWSIDINTLRPRQDGRHFADDIFTCVFLNEDISISINISLKFVPKGPINNIPALVQIMARRRPGDKPLSEPMMMGLLTHICVTRPQWVKKTLPADVWEVGHFTNVLWACNPIF